jgi:hypothetical protein
VIGEGQRDRRDRHLHGDPVGLDVVQHALQVEPPVQPHPDAQLEGRGDVQQAEDVAGRGRDLDPVVLGQFQGVPPVADGRAQRAVRVPDGLRQAGGARAEHEDGLGGWVVRPCGADAASCCYRLVQVQHRHEAREHRVVAHRVLRVRDRERVLGLGLLPRGAEQHHRGAEPPDRLDRDDPLRAVRAHERDPVAGLDTTLGEGGRQPVGQGVELRVCVFGFLEDERDALAPGAPVAGHREGVSL